MNKILLVLSILGAGAGAFVSTRQSTGQLQHEANAAREAWLAQTQLVAVAQNDQASLTGHIRQMKLTLAQPQAVEEILLWSAVQTNRAGHLAPELREPLLEELGFNWQSSPDYIVVSKETVREIWQVNWMQKVIEDRKLTDLAAAVFALTADERGQVDAALQRANADSRDWALAHIERGEPQNDVVAQYTMPGDPAMAKSIHDNFTNAVLQALGRERAELITAEAWRHGVKGTPPDRPATLIIRRYMAGNEQRLKVQRRSPNGATPSPDLWRGPNYGVIFPDVFRAVFPEGWDDVAKREGFELPENPQEK